MNDQEKAIEKLTKARGYVQWNITNIRNGNVHPNGENVADLKKAKRLIVGVLDEVRFWEPGNGNGNGVIIIDNPKPDWMPKMICTIVDLPFNVGRDYSWEELEQLVIEESLAGCDGFRIFANGWKPHIEAYGKMPSGEYSFFKPNPTYDATLITFAELCHKYHMSLEVDLYDNCSHKLDWNPFTTKRHGFSKYFYGYTKTIKTNRLDEEGNVIEVNEVDFMIEYHDNRIMACLDPAKGDKVRLGNELKSHVEDDVNERKIWAEQWGVTRAKNIFDHGFPPPVCFSGSTKTAHKLHGYISAEEHGPDAKPHNGTNGGPYFFLCEDYGWTYRQSGNEIHGKGTPAHVLAWAENGISQRRVFCYDDDGVGTNQDSQVPQDQRGYCEIRINGSEYACTANTATRVEAVRLFIRELGDRTYCYSIGFLPRSILYKDKTTLSRFDKAVDAEIYTRVAQDLWGVDIRRTKA